ncbi:hypothetical protein HAX54_010565 [Datura stramonium]|uniref:Uncharacterized protein n=1 Tax=Datura stramonium TaxID=4076 RepID=A0ABS8TJ69_DATST|nr:hypothetical protein [Datura stramonium]
MTSQISIFQIRDWEPFTMPLDPYFAELVKDFYASYRGQEVPITPGEINSIYWVDLVHPSQDFKRKLDAKDDQFKWVAEIIIVGQPHWALAKGVIH